MVVHSAATASVRSSDWSDALTTWSLNSRRVVADLVHFHRLWVGRHGILRGVRGPCFLQKPRPEVRHSDHLERQSSPVHLRDRRCQGSEEVPARDDSGRDGGETQALRGGALGSTAVNHVHGRPLLSSSSLCNNCPQGVEFWNPVLYV